MALDSLLYWKHKQPLDNQWRPAPGQDLARHRDTLPTVVQRMDVPAMVVDAAPIVAVIGAATHISQLRSLGSAASANWSTYINTMVAVNRAAATVPALLLLCQATGLNYRAYLPRWANERERERDEGSVREHIRLGMQTGTALWLTRLVCGLGAKRLSAPVDVLAFGALGDVMQRNFVHTPAS